VDIPVEKLHLSTQEELDLLNDLLARNVDHWTSLQSDLNDAQQQHDAMLIASINEKMDKLVADRIELLESIEKTQAKLKGEMSDMRKVGEK